MAFHIKIGNYRFSKNLGVGSFGKVKLAFNEVTGHKVAIKILNKKKIKQQGVFEKVKREIKVLRQFNHPHIIKHYEFIDTPSDIFMVIEFASGGELFDLISRRDRLTEEEARRFFQQIYSSIEYTHAHKIAHRDLKPENLLLDEFNNIKLIDFGLANSMKDSQALKTACGSPNYAAPEVISGRSYGGSEVDVWSLGVILFAMVCGSFPFDDDSIPSLFSKIKEGKYFMPDFISADVKDLINRMLQPNPVKRISIQEIKEHPWYLKDLPKYLQDLSMLHSKSVEIDRDIVKRLFTLNINLQGRSEEEIVKIIKDKKNTDFCGIYELYYHDNLKKECFKIQHQLDDDSDPFDSNAQFSSKVSSTSSQNYKFKHFKTLRHMMIHQEEDLLQRTPSSSMRKHQQLQHSRESGVISSLSLLSVKHNERLQRIVKKIRSGDVCSLRQISQEVIKTVTVEEQLLNSDTGTMSVVSTQVETAVSTQTTLQQQIQTKMTKTTTCTIAQQHQKLLMQRQPPQVKHQKWVFGLIFKGTPIDLLSLTCEVLKLLDMEWQIIPKDLKMKCRSRIDENSVFDYESSLIDGALAGGEDPLVNINKDEMIKEFLRKNFLKFYINIYKDQVISHSMGSRSSLLSGQGNNNMGSNQMGSADDQSSARYMLDIHLFKGTLCVFMDFVRRFMALITSACSQCSNMSCCSSSNNSQIERVGSSNHHHDYNLKIFM